MSTSIAHGTDHPCWTCQSYGFMVVSDTAFCTNPNGPALRALASRGCTLFALELFMDTGEVPKAPPPIEWESPQARRVRDQRELGKAPTDIGTRQSS